MQLLLWTAVLALVSSVTGEYLSLEKDTMSVGGGKHKEDKVLTRYITRPKITKDSQEYEEEIGKLVASMTDSIIGSLGASVRQNRTNTRFQLIKGDPDEDLTKFLDEKEEEEARRKTAPKEVTDVKPIYVYIPDETSEADVPMETTLEEQLPSRPHFTTPIPREATTEMLPSRPHFTTQPDSPAIIQMPSVAYPEYDVMSDEVHSQPTSPSSGDRGEPKPTKDAFDTIDYYEYYPQLHKTTQKKPPPQQQWAKIKRKKTTTSRPGSKPIQGDAIRSTNPTYKPTHGSLTLKPVLVTSVSYKPTKPPVAAAVQSAEQYDELSENDVEVSDVKVKPTVEVLLNYKPTQPASSKYKPISAMPAVFPMAITTKSTSTTTTTITTTTSSTTTTSTTQSEDSLLADHTTSDAAKYKPTAIPTISVTTSGFFIPSSTASTSTSSSLTSSTTTTTTTTTTTSPTNASSTTNATSSDAQQEPVAVVTISVYDLIQRLTTTLNEFFRQLLDAGGGLGKMSGALAENALVVFAIPVAASVMTFMGVGTLPVLAAAWAVPLAAMVLLPPAGNQVAARMLAIE